MAHIIEEYAKHCGVKISRPQLIQHYYSLPCNKYITISNSNVACINYFYWEEVILLLRKNLEALRENIKIVQISDPSLHLPSVDIHVNNATINQVNYILANSLVHVCADDPSSHIASAFDRPIVSLFSHSSPSWSGPYWNVLNKPILLQPDYQGKKPSLAIDENPSLINKIYPDVVVNAILSQLRLRKPINHKVIHIGENYHFELREIVPDFAAIIQDLNGKVIHLRDDYHKSNDNLSFWLSNYRSTIITDREIPLELLRRYKVTITIINFICSHDQIPDPKYLTKLSESGIRFNIFIKDCSKEEIGTVRNKYFDHGIEVFKVPDIPSGLDLDRSDLFINSKKILFCKDGTFLSKYHWKNLDKLKKMGDDMAFIKVYNNQDFINELNHFYIYEQ